MKAASRSLLRLITPARRTSIRAALAEAAAAPDPREAQQWRSAATAMLVRGLIRGPVLNAVAILLAAAAVGAMNESTSDVANQATLLSLLGGAGLVGFLWARRAWIPGVLLGSIVAVEHVAAVALGVTEPHLHLPPGGWGAASLLILLVPAVAAAYGGAGIRRLVARR